MASKFFLKDYGSGTKSNGWFCRWGSIFANGRLRGRLVDFLILYLSFGVEENLRYLLELLHLVYLYEYSNYLGSRFIVQLVIVTWIVKCMLSIYS